MVIIGLRVFFSTYLENNFDRIKKKIIFVKSLKLIGDERYSVFKFKKKDFEVSKKLIIFVKQKW